LLLCKKVNINKTVNSHLAKTSLNCMVNSVCEPNFYSAMLQNFEFLGFIQNF